MVEIFILFTTYWTTKPFEFGVTPTLIGQFTKYFAINIYLKSYKTIQKTKDLNINQYTYILQNKYILLNLIWSNVEELNSKRTAHPHVLQSSIIHHVALVWLTRYAVDA